jgi:hypothetical protein
MAHKPATTTQTTMASNQRHTSHSETPSPREPPFTDHQRRTLKYIVLAVAAVIFIGPRLLFSAPGTILRPASILPTTTVTSVVTSTTTVARLTVSEMVIVLTNADHRHWCADGTPAPLADGQEVR